VHPPTTVDTTTVMVMVKANVVIAKVDQNINGGRPFPHINISGPFHHGMRCGNLAPDHHVSTNHKLIGKISLQLFAS